MDFVSSIDRHLRTRAFSHYGWAELTRPLSMDFYQEWLARGYHADMEYLRAHARAKEDPSTVFRRARTAIVVAKPYLPAAYGESDLSGARLALYARSKDYHIHFRAELEEVANDLRAEFVDEEFLCFTDSAPILERDLAHRAGLGWFGKNSCLIHTRHGSLFFLGQILTSLAFAAPAPPLAADACGTCDRCLRACPTGALEAPRLLNAGKCIAYWTIEARAAAPAKLRAQFGDWFFGCDVCQLVCPWNEKSHGKDLLRDLARERTGDRDGLVAELRWILRASHRQLRRRFVGTPLSRARPLGLKRNALYVIGNSRLHELRDEVQSAMAHAGLKEVAAWALELLGFDQTS